MHFGQNATTYGEDYLKGLTCEKLVTRIDTKGFTIEEWKNPSKARNEPLDMEAYCLAMLELTKRGYAKNTMWDQLEAQLAAAKPGAAPATRFSAGGRFSGSLA